MLSGRRRTSRGAVADEVSLVVEGPLVGMVELLVDPLGAAEDLGDGLARAGEEDAGGVDHGGQGVLLLELAVDRAERDGAGHRGTEAMPAAGDGDRRPLRIGDALKVGWRNRARRSSLATRRSTGTTPSRIRRWARWPATSASVSPRSKLRQVASTARVKVRPSSRSRCRSRPVSRRRQSARSGIGLAADTGAAGLPRSVATRLL